MFPCIFQPFCDFFKTRDYGRWSIQHYRKMLLCTPYKWWKWGLERISVFPNITWVTGIVVSLQPHIFLSPNLSLTYWVYGTVSELIWNPCFMHHPTSPFPFSSHSVFSKPVTVFCFAIQFKCSGFCIPSISDILW